MYTDTQKEARALLSAHLNAMTSLRRQSAKTLDIKMAANATLDYIWSQGPQSPNTSEMQSLNELKKAVNEAIITIEESGSYKIKFPVIEPKAEPMSQERHAETLTQLEAIVKEFQAAGKNIIINAEDVKSGTSRLIAATSKQYATLSLLKIATNL